MNIEMKPPRDKRHGLVIVNTGNGKGKTTAALGTAFRALGWGWKVAMVQFVKGGWKTGEKQLADMLDLPIDIIPTGKGFSWRKDSSPEEDKKEALTAWETAKKHIAGDKYDLVILDELNAAVYLGFIDIDEIIQALQSKPEWKNVIITGRNASEKLIQAADLVSEVKEIKHPFEKGIIAQRGIEF